MTPLTATSEVAIFGRVIDEGVGLDRDLANHLLSLRFAREDVDRMNELASKARDGDLTADEESALENYHRVSDLLALWHAKARRTTGLTQ